MPDDVAFLKAICASPVDESPRLIHADLLDERGDPRGEFIRTQLVLERYEQDEERCTGCGEKWHDQHKEDCPWLALREREIALLRLHGLEWAHQDVTRWCVPSGPLDWSTEPTVVRFLLDPNGRDVAASFVGGFLGCFSMTWELWRDVQEDLRRHVPMRSVSLSTPPRLFLGQATSDLKVPACLEGVRSHWETLAPEPFVSELWDVVERRLVEQLLARVWPGIEFTLPPPGPAIIDSDWDNPSADIVRDLRRVHDRMMADLGLPKDLVGNPQSGTFSSAMAALNQLTWQRQAPPQDLREEARRREYPENARWLRVPRDQTPAVTAQSLDLVCPSCTPRELFTPERPPREAVLSRTLWVVRLFRMDRHRVREELVRGRPSSQRVIEEQGPPAFLVRCDRCGVIFWCDTDPEVNR